ncbi:hypothetical protein [Streptomyces sp. Tu 3180]|uniref:nSTAND1 domain-containing NTPase n=1 Tax=Streptomyces sp. Tu 3180 TaxID=2682611 RepID=UPI001359C49A|nr:hypothetical protein [Streptomyces sp. Tu 3180]KAF3463394.1 hypothetical protein GL259_02975 [Streptomyces sp. Tu 3180]
MGRKEKPLNPDAGPVQRFAADLRTLRTEAGAPTYRAMAQQSGYSAPALSQAAAGEKLPTLAVTLAYVAACGGDADDWEKRWRAVAEELAAVPREDADAEESPYRGLMRFEPQDAEVFFGRDQLVESLLELVSTHRCVVVLGPSGSGKSSLLRAGLVPRLRDGAGPQTPLAAMRILTPGAHPVRTHAERLRPAENPGDTLVLVDQFEEVFTLCPDSDERSEFIDLLLTSREPASRLRVVLGVRADFYGRCLEHPELVRVVREAGVPVGPPSREELREVIVRPATARGLTVERALTAQLLDEVAGEPGGLPLLSHALLETWRRRSGRMLTLRAYEAAGGVQGAVAQTAEELYGELEPAQATLVRRILLRLIAPGEGTTDTCRPVDRAELRTARSPAAETGAVLERLARARLVTLDGDAVHLAHEALITSWPRLRAWIEEDRHRLYVLRRLTDAAATWQELDRDPGALYRGSRLAEADEVFADARDDGNDLTPVEQDFLDASRSALIRERRRTKGWVASVSVLLVLALVAGVVAWQQNRTSDRRQLEAAARRAATAADSLRSSDPELALRLSAAASQLSRTPETRSALFGALGQHELAPFVPPRSGPVHGYVLDPDGRSLTTAGGSGGISRWDLRTRRLISSHRLPPGADLMSSLSPDGRYMAVHDEEAERARLWDVRAQRFQGDWIDLSAQQEAVSAEPTSAADQAVPDSGSDVLLPAAGTAYTEGFSSGGRAWTLLTRDRLQVWETRDGRRLFNRSPPGAGADSAYDIDPDNRNLAVCTRRGLQLWDLRAQRRLSLDWSAQPVCGPDDSLQFSPDGRVLAVSAVNGLRRWDVTTGKELPRLSQAAMEYYVFSNDGQFVAGVGSGAIVLWRTDHSRFPVFRHALTDYQAEDLQFDLESGVLRYVTQGTRDTGVVRSVDVSRVLKPAWRRHAAGTAVLSADGSTLAVLRDADGRAGNLVLYDARTGRLRSKVPGVPPPQEEDPWTTPRLSLSADGRRLAHSSGPRGGMNSFTRITVWDTVRHRRLTTVEPPDGGPSGFVLSPDGRELTTLDEFETAVTVWDADDGRRLRRTSGRTDPEESGAGGTVNAVSPDGGTLLRDDGALLSTIGRHDARVMLDGNDLAAFSPDGDIVATSDAAGRITLWDVRRRTSLGILSGGLSTHAMTAEEDEEEEEELTTALAFSPDGSVLAAAGSRGTLRMWDVASRQSLGTGLPTAGDDITSLAFSRDGGTLLLAGRHVLLQRYAIDPARMAATVCRRAGGTLTREQWRTYLADVPYRRLCGRE